MSALPADTHADTHADDRAHGDPDTDYGANGHLDAAATADRRS